MGAAVKEDAITIKALGEAYELLRQSLAQYFIAYDAMGKITPADGNTPFDPRPDANHHYKEEKLKEMSDMEKLYHRLRWTLRYRRTDVRHIVEGSRSGLPGFYMDSSMRDWAAGYDDWLTAKRDRGEME